MARGRMLSTLIAEDAKFNKMSMEAQFMFMRTIPHLDRDGLINGHPFILHGRVAPLMPQIAPMLDSIIDEWINAGMVINYDADDTHVLFFKSFSKNQIGMRYDRESPSTFPPPPGYERTKDGLQPITDTPKIPPSQTPLQPNGYYPQESGKSPARVRQESGSTPPEVEVEVKENLKEYAAHPEQPAPTAAATQQPFFSLKEQQSDSPQPLANKKEEGHDQVIHHDFIAHRSVSSRFDGQREFTSIEEPSQGSEPCDTHLAVEDYARHVTEQCTPATAQPTTKAILDAFVLTKREYEPGAIINYGKEGKAAKAIAQQGWTPDQVIECGKILYTEPFYQDKPLSLMSIASQIGAKLRRTPPPGSAPIPPPAAHVIDMEAIFGKSH